MNNPNPDKPTPESLAWIEDMTEERIDAEKIKKMPGATSSLVFEIPFIGESRRDPLVLRLFHKKEWLEMEPDLAKHESESLAQANKTKILSPEPIAYDETGERCGMPAVLMTKIPGETVLQPDDTEIWLDEMAKTLAKLHEEKAGNFGYEYFSYNNTLRLEKPLWSKVPEEWMRAFFIVAGIRPQSEYCFIHRDYHPGNILWQEEKVAGVVDWVNGCRGPAGVDVGHCRVNLAQLFGISAADEFLEAYMRHAGENFHYEPYWDLLALTDILDGPPKVYSGWAEFGIKSLSDELIRHRLDKYMISLLDRFDN